jgi:hypothetical protein
MQRPKLMFSDTELQLALNRDVFLTKNRIIEHVYEQLGEIGNISFNEFDLLKPKIPEALDILPKISKGENYEGLPWVMLDYPRQFDKQKGHFAGRIFFWWGNYYLVQFQVSGIYLPEILKMVNQSLIPFTIKGHEVLAGFVEDPWDFKLPQKGLNALKSNFKPFTPDTQKVFKIAIALPIGQFYNLKEVSLSLFDAILSHWPRY